MIIDLTAAAPLCQWTSRERRTQSAWQLVSSSGTRAVHPEDGEMFLLFVRPAHAGPAFRSKRTPRRISRPSVVPRSCLVHGALAGARTPEVGASHPVAPLRSIYRGNLSRKSAGTKHDHSKSGARPPSSVACAGAATAVLHLRQLRCRLVNGEDVERLHRSRESLECELADRLHVDVVLDLRVETLRDENLSTGRLVGEP